MALFLDAFTTERFALICVNLMLHVFHLQLLLYVAPHNGDMAPKIGRIELNCLLIVGNFMDASLSLLSFAVIFCRDSLFLTGFLCIMTIAMRSMNRYRGAMPNWLASTHNAMTSVGLYKLLLLNGAPAASVTSSSGNQIEKIEQQDDSDGAVLVEMKKSETAYANTESLWPTIAHFIDRILFIVFVLVYLALLLVWLPKSVTIEDAKNALGIETK